MNAAATISNALLSSCLALSTTALRRCGVARAAVTRGATFSSTGEASAPLSAAHIHMTCHHHHHHHHLHPLPRSPSPFRPTASAAFPSAVIQRRSLFIQTATTPNPESLKFIPNGRLVLGHNAEESVDGLAGPINGEVEVDNRNDNASGDNINGVYITRKDHELIARSPLTRSLFDLDAGVKSVYLGHDFLTVTKRAESHWAHLQTPIFGCIMDFYSTNQPVMLSVPEVTDTTIFDDDDEVVAMIKELLETRIRPAVQEDGGDIRYVGFEEHTGVVTVQLAGSCVGCPSSSVTLKNGVENMLMHYIPEVTGVVPLEEEDDDDEAGEEEGYEVVDGVVVEHSSGDDARDKKLMKSYQDKLAAAGIPFSD